MIRFRFASVSFSRHIQNAAPYARIQEKCKSFCPWAMRSEGCFFMCVEIIPDRHDLLGFGISDIHTMHRLLSTASAICVSVNGSVPLDLSAFRRMHACLCLCAAGLCLESTPCKQERSSAVNVTLYVFFRRMDPLFSQNWAQTKRCHPTSHGSLHFRQIRLEGLPAPDNREKFFEKFQGRTLPCRTPIHCGRPSTCRFAKQEIWPYVVDCGKEKAAYPDLCLKFKNPVRLGSERRRGYALARVKEVGTAGQRDVSETCEDRVDVSGRVKSARSDVLREGARRMLLAAIEAEVDDYVEKHQQERDERGHRLGVRNGYARERRLHDICLAATREAALKAWDRCMNFLGDKYPNATACLEDDRQALLAFYDLPAVPWAHLRTPNPIASTFATVRLRHRRTEGCGSRHASLTMIFMLTRQAERHGRKRNGAEWIVPVLNGKPFQDGILVKEIAA